MPKAMLFFAMLFLTQNSLAVMNWSTCQAVTGVGDYRAFDNSVYYSLSPGIAGCFYGGVQRVRMTDGVLGVTSDTLKASIAIGLTAVASRVPVRFYYDNSDVKCNVQIVALGGYGGECQ